MKEMSSVNVHANANVNNAIFGHEKSERGPETRERKRSSKHKSEKRRSRTRRTAISEKREGAGSEPVRRSGPRPPEEERITMNRNERRRPKLGFNGGWLNSEGAHETCSRLRPKLMEYGVT